MLLASSAAIAGTVLAVLALVPQMLKLYRTGLVEGVSPTWAAFGFVTNVAWTAYLAQEGLWLTVPATALVTVAYAMTFVLLVRAGVKTSTAITAGAIWATTLIAVAVAGGWSALGIVLGLSHAVQAAPSVWTAYRTPAPRGIAPGTWAIGLVEGLLWGYYGWFYADVPLMLFAVVATIASVAMLARYATTRHRWLEPAPSST
jgi:uncharacterized protein with PQ loop repeat